MPEAEKTARGRAIVNLLQLGEGEKVNAVIRINEEMRGNLIMATKRDVHDVVVFVYLHRLNALRVAPHKADVFLAETYALARAGRHQDLDFVENMFVTCTHDDVLFFTNYGKVYSIKAYEVPEAERTARGRALRRNGYICLHWTQREFHLCRP